MKNGILKITSSILLGIFTISLGNYCYELHSESKEPIVIDAISKYDTIYDYSNNDVIKEKSDLVVVGKVTEIGNASNYNSKSKEYHKALTPGKLEVIEVVKSDVNEKMDEIDFMDIGGTISYEDYAKSLLPAQREKREYLMKQSGIMTVNNVFVNESVEDQLDLEVGETYIMYLKYNEDYNSYIVTNQPYGIKKYNPETQEITNHVTKEVAKLEDLM